MITYEMIKNAQLQLTTVWGKDGEKVIEECAKVTPFNGKSEQFISYCTACGGDWIAMLLSGVRELYPTVWDAIPDDIGPMPFSSIVAVLVLCGIDTSE